MSETKKWTKVRKINELRAEKNEIRSENISDFNSFFSALGSFSIIPQKMFFL